MDFQQIKPYPETAWNSESFACQKPRPEQGVLTKLLQGGDPLPWCRTQGSGLALCIQQQKAHPEYNMQQLKAH